MYIEDEELRDLYRTSAPEHIQAIESALMQLEKQPQNPAVLKDLLRSAHTLKGDSRMLGVEDVETLVHQIEECLVPLEKGTAGMTGELCDRLYSGLDTIKLLVHTAVTGEANDVNMFYVLATLMGDGEAVPLSVLPVQRPISAEIESGALFDLDLGLDPNLQLPSNDWMTLSNEETVFDTPSDIWVHEATTSDLPEPIEVDLAPQTPPVRSALQTRDRKSVV